PIVALERRVPVARLEGERTEDPLAFFPFQRAKDIKTEFARDRGIEGPRREIPRQIVEQPDRTVRATRAAGDVVAIAPFTADVDPGIGKTFLAAEVEVVSIDRHAGAHTLKLRIRVDLAYQVQQADSGNDRQDQRHQKAIAQKTSQENLKA